MTSQDDIVVGFDWQPGEHAEVVQILTRGQFRSLGWRALKWVIGIVIAAWLLLVAINMFAYGDLTLLFTGLPWLLFVAFWVWLFGRGIGSLNARQSAGLNADVNYPFVHRFSEAGLRIDGFGSSVELRWDGMVRAQEEDGFFMFYWNPKCAYYTPKRAIPIPDQNRLRDLAQRKLGADARMRAPILPP